MLDFGVGVIRKVSVYGDEDRLHRGETFEVLAHIVRHEYDKKGYHYQSEGEVRCH